MAFPAEHEQTQDPRLNQIKELVREVLRDRQLELTGVRPADPERSQAYAEWLDLLAELRGGGLYYPYLGTGVGRGALVELADGSVKYDMISGIGVHVFGHGHPELAARLVEAALSDTVMQGNLQQNLDTLQLIERLVGLAQASGAALPHCFLSTSGATANENGLKLLFQAKHPADRLLAFSNGFAGRTLALAQVTDRPGNREGLPTTIAVDYVPFYRAESPEVSPRHSLAVLRTLLDRYPGKHAGMMLELIQGEGGYYSAPREFFVGLFEELRQREIPIFVDEVQTFGRGSRLFAFQELELDSYVDVVSIGKLSQVCATFFSDHMKPRPGLISQTFTGATASIHAALFVLDQFEQLGLLGPEGRTARVHRRFVEHFERMQLEFPEAIAGPWGQGGMLAFTVFDGSPERTKAFLTELFQQGVIAFPAGAEPTRVRMLPPLLAIQEEEIDAACEIIRQVLQTQYAS